MRITILLISIISLMLINIAYSGIALINETLYAYTGKNNTFCFYVFNRFDANVTIITPKFLETIFDKVYITNNSFFIKSYRDVCNDINCVFNELCYKRNHTYCKPVCYIFYKEKEFKSYVKEYNASVSALYNNMFAETISYKIVLINEGYEVFLTILILVIVVLPIILFIIKNKFL